MRNQKSKIKHQESPGGFTIVECLIGLFISVILLTAMATAFNASVINYRENEEMYGAINNARQALMRMTSQIRTGHTIDPTATANQCNFFTSANEDITYEYRSADSRLYLITNSNSREYVLCDGVTAATFTKTPTADGLDCKSVQISLTVQCGDYQRTLSTASVVRRNLGF